MSMSPQELGESLVKEGRHEEAIPHLREALAARPDDEALWRYLGAALGSSGDRQGAIEAFQNAVSIAPDSAVAHYNLGVAQQLVGDLSGAHASLTRALALQPDYAQAREQLLALHGASAPVAPSVEAYVPEPPASVGRALLSVVLATVSSIVGVVIWAIIAIWINISFLAIGVGWLTGFAAAKGYGSGGRVPAAIAAVVSGLFIGLWTTLNMYISFRNGGGLGATWSVIFNILCLFWGVQRAYQTGGQQS